MARRPPPKTKLPLAITALAGLLALALAAWIVFGRKPQPVTAEPTVPVPPAAEQPVPMPKPKPATPRAP
ncbi:MAG TPA: hypothetical protein VF138_06800 [Caulobacteraceae bacterium]